MVNMNGGKKNSENKSKEDSKSNLQSAFSNTSQLQSTFHHWNGDEYVGQFAVWKEKQILTMQGRGVYKTADGQTYEGIWENDFLKDECKITFPDRSVFSGSLEDMMISGSGKYSFKEKVQLEGEFMNNDLIGNIYLKDPNQNYWKGSFDENEDFVNFYPLHPFWQSVLNLPSKSMPLFYGEATEENESLQESNY